MELVESVDRLIEQGLKVQSQDEHVLSRADWDEVGELSFFVLMNIHIHSLVPGVQGRGRTKLEDKMSSGLFMRYLDSGS